METPQTLWLIINSASGSNDEETESRLESAFSAAGHTPDRIVDIQSAELPSRAEIEGAGVTTLAIYTGDGTVNAAATAMEGWDGQLLVLPGGTSNLLSKSLHGDRPVEEIIEAFGAGRLTASRRDCIRCSQGAALIEILAGPGATWSDVREGMRDGDIAEVAAKTIEATRQSAGGSMVCVVEPPLGREEGYSGVRLVPESGGMTADGYGAQTAGDYVKQGIALLRRDFREGPHDELGHHCELLCRTLDGGAIELMIDGERRTGAAEERFSLAPLAVDLLALGDG